MLSTQSSPRHELYQRFPLSSARSSNSSNNTICACTQRRVIICVLLSWLILTVITYQKVYNVNILRSSRKKGAIPQHHSDALHLYGHLDEKIKEQQQKLKALGIDINNLQKDPLSLIKIKKQQTTTTKKPEFPKYFDIAEPDKSLHDLDWIRARMYYWKKGIAKHKNLSPTAPTGQYLTFWSDCGGFNNIRMGFEYMIIVAYLTNRTIVLPPVEGWYLIDFGSRARMNSKDTHGKSGYAEFFDFDHLSLEVHTISTQQFVQEMAVTLGFDKKYSDDGYFDNGMQDWRKYLNKIADAQDTNMGWGPLAHILNWPSIAAVRDNSAHQPDRMFISNRDNIEYTDRQRSLPWLHFPACDKGDPGTSRDFRYLGQIASFVWFDKAEKDNDLKRMLRDHVHLLEEVFGYASVCVQKLGAFQYAALHIRRNELQYKESFIAAAESLKHIKPLLKEDEVLYIATDEKEGRFFEEMEKEYTVYRWKDFFDAKSAMYLGEDLVDIPRKFEGVIEMAICAMGRIFFGTDTSTFTAYITRLRGYFDAPDKSTYHHNEQWTGDLERDSQKHHKLWGQTYMDEMPEMWENIKGTYR